MKLKTKKAAAKRFRFSATGKVKVHRAGKRHNLGGKSASLKRALRGAVYLVPGDARHAVKCMPYGR